MSPDETLINSITKDAMFQIWITPSQARLAAKWYAAGQAKKIGTVSAHVRARLALQVRSGASSGRAAQHISSWTHCRAKACTRCEEEECSEGHESGSMQVCGSVDRTPPLCVFRVCSCVSGAFRSAPSLLAEQHKLLMSVRGCCSLQVTFLVPPRTFSRWILA